MDDLSTALPNAEAGERLERLARLTMRLLGMAIVSVDLAPNVEREIGMTPQTDADATSAASEPLLTWVRGCTQPTFIADVRTLPEISKDPLVCEAPGIRSLGAWPIRDLDGERLGTVFVADCSVRTLDPDDHTLMADIVRGIELEICANRAAIIDRLTGLLNRRGFDTIGTRAFGHCRRHRQPLTLLSIDLNGFKPINDRFGHAEGDRALRLFAEVLTKSLRGSDVIGRIGGDEFLVLMPQSKPGAARVIVDRLRAATAEMRAQKTTEYLIEFSVGIIEYEVTPTIELDALLALADSAMYRDKTARKASGRSAAGELKSSAVSLVQ